MYIFQSGRTVPLPTTKNDNTINGQEFSKNASLHFTHLSELWFQIGRGQVFFPFHYRIFVLIKL